MKEEINLNFNSEANKDTKVIKGEEDSSISKHKENLAQRKNRKSFHRKTSSQIFSCDELLNFDNNIASNYNSERPQKNRGLSKDITTEKDTNFDMLNFIDQNINSSFNSIHIIDDENDEVSSSVIIKEEKKDNNKTISSNKSFIPLVNTLKFVKEKEENATESYLLALGLDKNPNKKIDYNVGSVIEEEKSDMLISESDFSSKKKILSKFNNDNTQKLDDVNINLNAILFKNVKSSRENESSRTSHNSKLSLTINEMIKRKAEKEKNHRNQLTNNKKYLLNTFYTLSNTSTISVKNDKALTTVNNKEPQNKKKIRRTLSQNVNMEEDNVDITDKIVKHQSLSKDKKGKSKTNQIKKIPSSKLLPSKMIHNKNPTLDLNNYNTNPIPFKKMNYHIKKKSASHIQEENEEPDQKIKNFANALNLLQTYKRKKNIITNSNTSRSGRESSSMNNHTAATRSNSQSSRSKEKNNVLFKKTKSQCNFNHILPSSSKDKKKTEFKGNRIEILYSLKNQLYYSKVYEKKDVIDKITLASSGFYIIMIEKKISLLDKEKIDYVSYILYNYYTVLLRIIQIL